MARARGMVPSARRLSRWKVMRVRSGSARPVVESALRVVLPTAVLAIVVVVWQSYAQRPGNFLMPGPTKFLAAVPEVVTSQDAWNALGTSDLSLVMGYAIAVVIGIPLGLA